MPSPKNFQQLLKTLSPVRPAPLRMVSKLGEQAAQLRGGRQPAAQLLKQLAGRPGVKQGALQTVFGHIDPATKLSPEELAAQALSPRLFAQRGAAIDEDLNFERLGDLTNDIIYGQDFLPRRAEILRSEVERELGYLIEQGADPAKIEDLRQFAGLSDIDKRDLEQAQRAWNDLAEDYALEDIYRTYESILDPEAREIAQDQIGPGGLDWSGFYSHYQRQPSSGGDYFETVLRGAPSLTLKRALPRSAIDKSPLPSEYHFANPAQLGHVRGSVVDGTMLLDELQSDPLELFTARDVPELEGIYGKLGRMAIDRAAEADLNRVSIPDANRIASVRSSRQLPFFQSIYDKALVKELYEPLAAQGVPVSYDQGFWNISLDDAIRDAVKHGGLLNYKRGGLAQACHCDR